MYDFGFYLEHSVYFRDYLQEEFANGTTINSLNAFDDIMMGFRDKSAQDTRFTSLLCKSNGVLLDAFGIKFVKIYEVNMNNVTRKSPVEWTTLERCKFWHGKTDTKNVKKILDANNICATSDAKFPGVYIWKFGKAEFYVGEADDIFSRLTNYNGANKGQTTNIKINNRIWNAHEKEEQETVELYFYPTEHHHDDVEQYIINQALQHKINLPLNDKDNK